MIVTIRGLVNYAINRLGRGEDTEVATVLRAAMAMLLVEERRQNAEAKAEAHKVHE